MSATQREMKQEFKELASKTGWTDAELARQLELTRGGIHGLLKGETNPSGVLIKLFRYVVRDRVAELGAGPARGTTPTGGSRVAAGAGTRAELQWERPVTQLAALVREIQEADPEGYKAVEKVIRDHHKRLPKKPVSSKRESAAATLLNAAASKPAGSRRK